MITPSTDTKVLPVALKLFKLVTLGQESAVTHNKVFKLLALVPFFIHIFRWQFHFMANFRVGSENTAEDLWGLSLMLSWLSLAWLVNLRPPVAGLFHRSRN